MLDLMMTYDRISPHNITFTEFDNNYSTHSHVFILMSLFICLIILVMRYTLFNIERVQPGKKVDGETL